MKFTFEKGENLAFDAQKLQKQDGDSFRLCDPRALRVDETKCFSSLFD